MMQGQLLFPFTFGREDDLIIYHTTQKNHEGVGKKLILCRGIFLSKELHSRREMPKEPSSSSMDHACSCSSWVECDKLPVATSEEMTWYLSESTPVLHSSRFTVYIHTCISARPTPTCKRKHTNLYGRNYYVKWPIKQQKKVGVSS